MAKRRFQAPARGEVAAAVFDHPIHAGYDAFSAWREGDQWPALASLNAALTVPQRRFVTQDRALLDDGLHYETRIAKHGQIATRAENWHDLFNAMVWCRWPAIKQALNARQCLHIATMGNRQRNRAQYALTQFDEAGVIVQIQSGAVLAHWDAHDWAGLFFDQAKAWQRGEIAVSAVIGHALLEHALRPAQFIVGKALVVQGECRPEQAVAEVARAIAQGRVLNDPLELRPLPLAGIPGWFAGQDRAFYQSAPCFQPRREGRHYPAALVPRA